MTTSGEWVRVDDFPTRDEAQRAGAMLLESGVVAAVDDEVDVTVLSVMPDDVERACELLGVVPPRAVPSSLDEPLPPEAVRWRMPRERLPLFVVGYVVVLLALGAGVFLAVAWLLGGFDSTEMPSTFPS